MTARKQLPDDLGAHFSVRDALAAGATADRLTASDLDRPFRGARMMRHEAASTETYATREHLFRTRCRAYLTVAPRDAVLSHATAARLYGMPLPRRLLTSGVHVVTTGQPPRMRGVVGHRWGGGEAVVVDGLPIVDPATVWLQLASGLTHDELVIAGDYLVRRKRPLSSLAAIEQASAGTGRGIARARAALREVRAGTDSPPESWMRLTIVRAGHPEPVVGCRVTHDGYWVGTPDLAYPDQRIAIEYQGEGHRTADVFEDDIFRLELFHDAGWIVIQVTARLLAKPGWLSERVRRALGSRVQL